MGRRITRAAAKLEGKEEAGTKKGNVAANSKHSRTRKGGLKVSKVQEWDETSAAKSNDDGTATSATNKSQDHAPSSSGFRFLDLPAEIRNRIYSLALPGEDNITSRNVANFGFPALTRASRQLRQESLPILFAESNFVFNVGTNTALPLDRNKYNASTSGTLGFKLVVGRFIKAAGKAAIFRDITFKVQPYWRPSVSRYKVNEDFDSSMATLTLRVEGGKVSSSSTDEIDHPRRLRGDWSANAKEMDEVLEIVKGIAEEVAKREGCKGFMMQDLRLIAKGFRLEAEE